MSGREERIAEMGNIFARTTREALRLIEAGYISADDAESGALLSLRAKRISAVEALAGAATLAAVSLTRAEKKEQ